MHDPFVRRIFKASSLTRLLSMCTKKKKRGGGGGRRQREKPKYSPRGPNCAIIELGHVARTGSCSDYFFCQQNISLFFEKN